MIKKIAFFLFIITILFNSCTTKPVIPSEDADPLALLPADDDFYLLVRPSAHPDLSIEILKELIPVNAYEIYPALERTELTVVSGKFGKPLEFSARMEGKYPVLFVRSSLNKSDDWEKVKDKTYRGPDNILAGTAYKNLLLAANDEKRLDELENTAREIPTDADVLSREDRDWWLSGTPAILFYQPDLRRFPMPHGLPAIAGGSHMILSMVPSEDKYSLSGDIVFSDDRAARLWAFGLKIFLGGRLGMSPKEEERQSIKELTLKTEGSVIRLRGWTMSSEAWGEFISEF